MVTIRQQYSKQTNNIGKGVNSRKYITVHQTGNRAKGATAAAHANLQTTGNVRVASWHATVDEKEAVESFPRTVVCYHAGTTAGNTTSIGVEVCINADGDYKAAIANAAEYVAHVARAEGIPLANIVQHNHWSGKNCPEDLRAGRDSIKWADFLAQVKAAYDSKPAHAPVVAAAPAQVTVTAKFDVLNLNKDTLFGPGVKLLQALLVANGYNLPTNSRNDANTKATLLDFQKHNQLDPDGIVGAATWTKLLGGK